MSQSEVLVTVMLEGAGRFVIETRLQGLIGRSMTYHESETRIVGMRIGTMNGVVCQPHNLTDRFCEVGPPIPLGEAHSYRVPLDPAERRRVVLGGPTGDGDVARPIHIGRNSWVGFGACVLPGVTIGEVSIVTARSVVARDVPAYVVVAGNPARIVGPLTRDEIERP